MRYNYAIVNDSGRCYELRASTFCICNRLYVPIDGVDYNYLSKYYWPLPEFVDTDEDFSGDWYSDAAHTVKEVAH